MTQPVQNLFCIGAQKAGTSTLAEILGRHSDIYVPAQKETKFFLFDEDYAKGLEWYNKTYYSGWKGQHAVGEIDPDYMFFPFVAERLADSLGKNLRFLVVLRNPADRAYSHYLMSRKKGVETLGFREALDAEPQRQNGIREQKIFAYLGRGFYARQLQPYLSLFPASNFLFLIFEEDILRRLPDTIGRIQDFLGVRRETLDTEVHALAAGEAKNEQLRDLVRKPNFVKRVVKSVIPARTMRKKIRHFFIAKNLQKASVPHLDPVLRKEIIDTYFTRDILETQKLTGLDLSQWISAS